MGSVSSLISGHSLNSKHCHASEVRLKKGTHHKKTSRSADGLAKYGFTQGPSASHAPKPLSLSQSQAGWSEDFFYIKVGHKARAAHHRGGPAPLEDHRGEAQANLDPGGGLPPKLLSLSGILERSIEKALVRPTAFKPVIPRSTSSSDTIDCPDHVLLSPAERTARDPPGHKQDTLSGTLSDSGRNSMSSLPTLSTNGSLSASAGPPPHPVAGSAGGPGPTPIPHPNVPPWTNRQCVASGIRGLGPTDGGAPPPPRVDVSPPSSEPAASPLLEERGGGLRSPITPDDSLIERLEQRLLERETELQELQVSFEDKEDGTCRLFEEKQRYCAQEMEGLKERCSTKLRQVSQRVARSQQALQLQLGELETDKRRLQDELAQLAREKELAEVRLRSYESEQLAPTLEETQWEVCQKTGEISLLKQQLRDSKADVALKLNEIVTLRASLKETRGKMEVLEQQNTEHEERIHCRTVEVEVCQNELQRKKNEANLLRGKVGKLETDIQGMKHDLGLAKEQRHQQALKLEAQALAQVQAAPQLGQSGAPCQAEDKGGHMPTDALQREVERLRGELREERETQQRLANSFEQERQTWNREKDRVIKYQKQLQINYLQMYKKNQDLERILQELTAELDSRPDLDLDIHSSGLHYEDMIATEI
ncbi:leucine zipper putative tumor suppressor 1 [Hypomesus transpacificus]|uniref:leucine zipper putative tumor suppressor 1 n=1 Tax=Hypomesus transpacificus TaxID=137520 RepID=UPI001F071A29|nr:leucine zipper putative tumor suppressor 1 [Hypomesus transpacificus]